MASMLGQLRGELADFQSDATRTGRGLEVHTKRFTVQQGRINALIGGSTRRVDAELIDILEQAHRQLMHHAIMALDNVAKATGEYADSLWWATGPKRRKGPGAPRRRGTACPAARTARPGRSASSTCWPRGCGT